MLTWYKLNVWLQLESMMMGVTAVRKYDDGGSVVIIIQLCSVAKQF